MSKIEEILLMPDIGEKIEQLKLHRGIYAETNTTRNLEDWIPEKHEIMTNKDKYPDSNVIVEKGKTVTSHVTGKLTKMDDKTETVAANRICVPIERDIVNLHTGFTVGLEPILSCESADENEQNIMKALKYTFKKNFIKFKNKQEVRSLFSEQEVAEYWYMKDDNDGFWSKMWRFMKSIVGISSSKRPSCVVWSPFRGDILYPFMEDSDMTGFLREYKIKNSDNSEMQCYMCITDKEVITWKQENGNWIEHKFSHGFGKIPVVYMWRNETLCNPIKTLRIRLEKLMSQYADCIDYHFFPYLLLFGEIEKWDGTKKNRILQMIGTNANAQYLAWNQVPDTVKTELNNLISMIYSMTHTPRISLDDLKGMSAPSGTAFKFYFLQILSEVENHAEIVGEFLQRRVNLVITILGSVNAELSKASATADIDTEIQPYMLDDISNKVNTAVKACGGAIWDKATGISFVGNIDNVNDVVEKLKEEQTESSANGKTDTNNKDNSTV